MDQPFRIAPVAPPYPPDVAASLGKWMPPGAAVEPLALFRVLQRHPALAERMRPLGAFLLGKTSLTLRERELVILRSCARSGAEYEWGVHASAFGGAAGLDAAALDATRAPAPGGPLDAADRALLAVVDELHDTGTVSDAGWRATDGRFSDEARLELLVLVGFYHLISFVANGARVELEAWAARWLQ
ncbi:MAG TPA: carboxymuconolactone decarboxylase family protein [Polyangia bacterium]